MRGSVYAFLMALACVASTFLPWWGRLLLIPVAVAVSAWFLWSTWRLYRLFNPRGEPPLIFPDNR